MPTPNALDVAAAVRATETAIDNIDDDVIQVRVSQVVVAERRAVLGVLHDYETAIAESSGVVCPPDPWRYTEPMLTPAERIKRAVEATSIVLANLDREYSAVAHAIWHERTIVAMLCGTYQGEVQSWWLKHKAAEPVAVMVRNGEFLLEKMSWATDEGQPPADLADRLWEELSTYGIINPDEGPDDGS